MVGRMTAALLTTLLPGSQRIVGGGVAGIAVIAMDFREIDVVAGSAVDSYIKVRFGTDPTAVIVTVVREDDDWAAAGRRSVIEICMNSFEGTMAGGAAYIGLLRSCRGNPYADQKQRGQ